MLKYSKYLIVLNLNSSVSLDKKLLIVKLLIDVFTNRGLKMECSIILLIIKITNLIFFANYIKSMAIKVRRLYMLRLRPVIGSYPPKKIIRIRLKLS